MSHMFWGGSSNVDVPRVTPVCLMSAVLSGTKFCGRSGMFPEAATLDNSLVVALSL